MRVVLWQSLRDGPRAQHALLFQTQVEMVPRPIVLMEDEHGSVGHAGRIDSARDAHLDQSDVQRCASLADPVLGVSLRDAGDLLVGVGVGVVECQCEVRDALAADNADWTTTSPPSSRAQKLRPPMPAYAPS